MPADQIDINLKRPATRAAQGRWPDGLEAVADRRFAARAWQTDGETEYKELN